MKQKLSHFILIWQIQFQERLVNHVCRYLIILQNQIIICNRFKYQNFDPTAQRWQKTAVMFRFMCFVILMFWTVPVVYASNIAFLTRTFALFCHFKVNATLYEMFIFNFPIFNFINFIYVQYSIKRKNRLLFITFNGI